MPTRWNISSLVKIFNIYGFLVITAEVEPFKIYDHNWSNFISQKLGINGFAEIFAGKFVGKPHGYSSAPNVNSLRKTIAGFSGKLYLKVFFPFLAFLTLPLRTIVRKQGNTIYFLISPENQERRVKSQASD